MTSIVFLGVNCDCSSFNFFRLFYLKRCDALSNQQSRDNDLSDIPDNPIFTLPPPVGGPHQTVIQISSQRKTCHKKEDTLNQIPFFSSMLLFFLVPCFSLPMTVQQPLTNVMGCLVGFVPVTKVAPVWQPQVIAPGSMANVKMM